MRYIHQIVKKGNRDATHVEPIYTNSANPKFSMKIMVGILMNVQYEIVNRKTNEIQLVTSN